MDPTVNDSNIFSGGTSVSGYSEAAITDKATSWLDTWSTSASPEPFLLLTHYKATHRTWMVPLADLDIYSPDEDSSGYVSDNEIPEPPTLFDDYATRYSAFRQSYERKNSIGGQSISRSFIDEDLRVDLDSPSSNINVGSWPKVSMGTDNAAANTKYNAWNAASPLPTAAGEARTRWLYRRYIREYLRTAHVLDRYIGELIQKLKDLGIYENTVIVYVSDQGFYLGEPWLV